MKSGLLSYMIILLLIISCKEERDEVAPRISITSPLAGSVVEMPDTLIVTARVEDNERLDFVNFGLVDTDLSSVGERVSVNSLSNPEEFSLSLVVNDLDIESGTHFLEVFASDGENDSRDFVELQVIAIPKVYEGCMVLDDAGAGSSVTLVDVDGQQTVLASAGAGQLDYSVDSRWAAVSVYDRQARDLKRYSIESGLELWSVSSLLDPTEEGLVMLNDPYSRATRLLSDVPAILSVNREGMVISEVDLDPEWEPYLLLIEESHYWVVSDTPSGHRVSQVFKSSGAETDFFMVPDRPQRIARLNQQELILITEEGDIRILNTLQGGQFTVPVAASDGILDLLVVNGAAYFISASELFRFSPSGFQAQSIYSGVGLQSLTYDEVGQRLILSEAGVLGFFYLGPFQPIGTIPVGNSLARIEAVFNK